MCALSDTCANKVMLWYVAQGHGQFNLCELSTAKWLCNPLSYSVLSTRTQTPFPRVFQTRAVFMLLSEASPDTHDCSQAGVLAEECLCLHDTMSSDKWSHLCSVLVFPIGPAAEPASLGFV